VHLTNLEVSQIEQKLFEKQDIIVSNVPLDFVPVKHLYISTIPTKNELRQLTELTLEHYL
jgi:hypothetical protein